ncbi:hypothetical protein R3P38DRAFT_3117021 [Favolaschia claudopus]|uniref:F-box domain-containing protein n=1 Tax=Favolaschia claudopus TaxID=2862362 RepID=A0AAV9ZEY1_9AGAR
MELLNPLDLPELLDLCLGLLGRSPIDLCSCARVARAWVYPAQSLLFRSPTHMTFRLVISDITALRFRSIVIRNPHLAALVREFSFRFVRLARDTIDALCTIEFVNLQSLTIETSEVAPIHAFHKLSSLPTLRFLTVFIGDDGEGEDFPQCIGHLRSVSAAIQHLCIGAPTTQWKQYLPSSSSARDKHIKLKSFRLQLPWHELIASYTPIDCNAGSFFPFDLSEVRAFSTSDERYAPWPALSKARIEILDMTPSYTHFDLSPFTNLTVLRLVVYEDLLPVTKILPSICSAHPIHTILIRIEESQRILSDGWHELFFALGSLPLNPFPDIELEFVHSAEVERFQKGIGRSLMAGLASKTRVKITAAFFGRMDEWWQSQIEGL